MAEQQTIKYAPQWTNMTVDNVIFQTNNVVGNFNYLPNVPTYNLIIKFLRNCPLYNAFINYPSVVYHNFLKEFWSTSVAFDPFSSTDEPEKRPLKEFLIKFSILNGQRPLTLDNHTFCSSTGLNYNNGKYVDHPTPEVVKKELGKIAINPSYLEKTPVLKNSFLVAWRILFTFVIQGLEASGALIKKSKRPKSKKPPTKTKATPPKLMEGSKQSHSVSSGIIPHPQDLERDIQLASIGFPSTLDEGTCKSKPLPESTATHPKDLRGNVQPLNKYLTFTTSDEGAAKTTPHPKGSLGDKESRGNKQPADMEPINHTVVNLSGTGAKYQEDQTQSFRLRYQSLTKNKGKPSSEGEPNTQPMLLTYTDVQAIILSEDEAQESEEDILGAGEQMDESH
ncbi:hypothetical protein Tco_1241943 [Tanacetum coccineum]